MTDHEKEECDRTGTVVTSAGATVMTRAAYASSIGYNAYGKPMSVTARFDQREWWLTKDGRWLRIAEMEPGHRYNTAAMLLRTARLHAFRYAWGFAGEVGAHDGGEMAHDALERMSDEITRRSVNDPHGWLRGTALYQALTAGLTIQGDGMRPWQAEKRDPATGEPCEVPPPRARVCAIPACGCSGSEHA